MNMCRKQLMCSCVREFNFHWDDTTYEQKVKAYFEYSGSGAFGYGRNKYRYERKPPVPTELMTQKIMDTEMRPSIKEWLDEKVQNKTFGGLYGAGFSCCLCITTNEHMFGGGGTRILCIFLGK